MKAYLVEGYNPEIEFDKESIIVALTPEVCYQLDKKGVEYSIIEDYYDVVELSNQVEEYRQSVFCWIDELDKFLLNNIKGLNLKLGTIYRWYLKGMILDPLYGRSYILQSLFKAINPKEVTFILPKPDKPHLNYRFEHYGRSLYSQIIPILCHENNILLTTVFLKPDIKEVKEIKSVSQAERLITRLKKILVESGTTRNFPFIYKCSKKMLFTKRAKQGKLNIFILKTAHIGEGFIVDALVRGHNVYLLSGISILKYSCLGARSHLNLQDEYGKVIGLNNNLWEYAANLLEGHALIRWVNGKCALDVSEIVLPRLRHFILKVCPEIERYIKVFTEFYDRDRIDILFTPHVSPLMEYVALAAAKHHPQVKTACLAHGDGVYDSRTWNITELQNYDIHISSNTETKEYFRHLCKEIHSTAKIHSSPYRLLNVKKVAYAREKRGSNIIIKNMVIYLPLFMMWDTRRMEDGPYSDTWYYQFQKSLIKYFSTRGEYTFVWKGLPQTDEIYNPILDFIRDNNFSNIEVATNSFTQHLLSADRVICDCPSTGFYESVIAGVSTMSLYHKALIVRKTATEYFGNLLKLYSDTSEAIKYIDEFLNSPLELYKMKIDMEGDSILDILEKEFKNKLG